jgi:hypothetical protein
MQHRSPNDGFPYNTGEICSVYPAALISTQAEICCDATFWVPRSNID